MKFKEKVIYVSGTGGIDYKAIDPAYDSETNQIFKNTEILIDGGTEYLIGDYSGELSLTPFVDVQIPTIYLDIQMQGAAKTNKKGGKASINTELTFIVTMQDADGNTIPISDSFAVPISDRLGTPIKVKGLVFTDGIGTMTITLTASGYYYIKSDAVNELSEDATFIFDDFIVVIFE